MSAQPDCTSGNTLSPHDRARLSHILSRLASPFENERAIAGLLASAFVEKHGLMWADLIALLRPRPEASPAVEVSPSRHDRRRNRGREWRGYCRRHRLPISQTLDLLA
jgi:hypothetical protein